MLHTEFLMGQESSQPTDLKPNEPRNWRIYFNSKSAYPHIWSVDEGSSESEILVRWFNIRECRNVTSNHSLGPQPRDTAEMLEREEQPVAWIEVFALAIFGGGGVTFYGN